MTEEQLKKIIYVAVAQLAKRVASFDDDEKLGMKTKQFGDVEFTKEQVKETLIRVNANYQEVQDNENGRA